MSNFQLTDFHTHILPKMDDGSNSVETSLLMLQRLQEQGVERVVLTPHYYSQREPIEKFLARRNRAFGILKEAYNGPISLHLGAEVYFSEFLFNLEDLSPLCIDETDVLLLEVPYNKSIDERMIDQFWRLSSEYGITLLLAHVERYPSLIKSRKTMDKLSGIGCLFQMNLSSFEVFGARRLLKYVDLGYADAIGTDAHNLESRPPAFDAGLEKIRRFSGDETIDAICRSMSELLGL